MNIMYKINQSKYVLTIENKIFCRGGFKEILNVNDSEIRLFATKQHAIEAFKKIYLNNDTSKIKIFKANVSIKFRE